MDTRIALKCDTELRFVNSSDGICVYTIENELARGASCIVYNASYVNNSGVKKRVRIKECYPFSLVIKRCEDGSLVSVKSDRDKFEERKNKMSEAFDLGNELFDTSGLTNFTSNTIDIYEFNNTQYVVTTYMEGKTLSYEIFSNLKECIAVVKSIAKVIEKIHQKEYLYLDIKPENIYILNDTNGVVQLFDFDSLVPLNELVAGADNCEYKISYTKGFSALELKTGNQKNIGKHTDVYAVGAILFYLVFGTIPRALDCAYDAEYDYQNSRYDDIKFQDRLYLELTDFFHNTLANYYLDRYPNMQQVIVKLEELEKLADTTTPYIQSSYIICPKVFTGRENEIYELDSWFKKHNNDVLFVTGMGGIGKSTLLRGYLSYNLNQFDSIIYLDYNHSLKHTVADDRNFVINTIFQREVEDIDEYFSRKLSIAAKLIKGQNVVLVIDNFENTSEADNMDSLSGLDELIQAGLKVIIITRNTIFSTEYECLDVGRIQEKNDIYSMFESYLRRNIKQEEYPVLDYIIENVQGHTLALELIARQIANSFLTITEAEDLMKEHGFSNMALEKVSYMKDARIYTDTIKNIIDRLFISSNISELKKSVLKAVSFFGYGAVSVNIFSDIYGLETKDVINELAFEGWITVDRHSINMHPIIIETVSGWSMTDDYLLKVNHIMDELCKYINLDKEMLLSSARKPCAGDEHIDKDMLLSYGERFVKNCNIEKISVNKQSYIELLFTLVSSMPRHREKYILENALYLADNLKTLSKDKIIKLFEIIIEIYEERRELDKAYEYILMAQQMVDTFDDNYIKAQYYYILVGYYDYKLDGYYIAANRNEKKILAELLKAIDKSIKYMKKSTHTDSKKHLAEYIRCKANVLIRNNPRKRKKIAGLLSKVARIIKEEGYEGTDLDSAYHLTNAWYYTYVELDIDKVNECIAKAHDIEQKICDNELNLIDNLMMPVANILLECGEIKLSEEWLLRGVKLCEQNEQIVPFIRKKMELYTYLLDVYEFANDEDSRIKLLDIIKEGNVV